MFRRKKTIAAIDKLIVYYNTYSPENVPPTYASKIGATCPLCEAANGKCWRCPWLRIEKGHCSDKFRYYQDYAGVRLFRLNRWRTKLTKSRTWRTLWQLK